MSSQTSWKTKDKPLCKDKVKEFITILMVANAFSAKINEKTKHPQILCPFHEDHNLGSCRIYPKTNTFKCEACNAHGDTLTLASGYLKISIDDLDQLLEKLVSTFGLDRKSLEVDYTGRKANTKQPERLTPNEYKELLMTDFYSIPISYKETEYEKDETDFIPCEYKTIYYRTLATSDPDFHDFSICTVSRRYWLRFAEMLFYCQEIGFTDMETILAQKLERNKALLKKGLVDKQLFKKELKLRNKLLNESLIKRSYYT